MNVLPQINKMRTWGSRTKHQASSKFVLNAD